MDYAEPDDKSLLRLFAYKHPDALSTLYDRYGSLVFSMALAIIKDQGSAEEITQDVFLRVWENAALYDQNRETCLFLFSTSQRLIFCFITDPKMERT